MLESALRIDGDWHRKLTKVSTGRSASAVALMMAAEGNDGGIARCDEGPRDEIEDSDERKQYPSMPSDTYTFLFFSRVHATL